MGLHRTIWARRRQIQTCYSILLIKTEFLFTMIQCISWFHVCCSSKGFICTECRLFGTVITTRGCSVWQPRMPIGWVFKILSTTEMGSIGSMSQLWLGTRKCPSDLVVEDWLTVRTSLKSRFAFGSAKEQLLPTHKKECGHILCIQLYGTSHCLSTLTKHLLFWLHNSILSTTFPLLG